MRLVRTAFLLTALFLLAADGMAHDLVLTTGYAASKKPLLGPAVDPHDFSSGGGYVVGARLDLDVAPHIWIAPSVLYWDNITGGQSGTYDSHYSQMQFGARVLFHTWTLPMLYCGGGADFAATRGVVKAGQVVPGYGKGSIVSEFDGEAPVGLVAFGFKGKAPLGLGVMAEVAYHFGLDEPVGQRRIGPASVVLLQIGVFLRGERP
ncbi:MAG: hypothetical protein V1784_01395 [bacterium]